MQQDSESLNVSQALAVLRRRLPLIALCVVVVAGASYAFSKQQAKKYTATASLAFNENQLSQELVGLPASSAGNLLAQQASNLELVKLGDMAERTARVLGGGLSAQSVANSLAIGGQGESSIVSVSATSPSPPLAARIANTYVHEFVTEQQAANQKYFKAALVLVDRQLSTLPPKQRFGPDAVSLQNRAQALRFLSELQDGSVRVAQEAPVPSGPSSPKTSRNTLLGGLLGLLLGLGLVILLERMSGEREIGSSEDLEAIYGLPQLGVVPDSPQLALGAGGRAPRRKPALGAAEAEPFHLIRAHLRAFNVGRELSTIVIASPQHGDGRTTVAVQLAAAAARSGSRALLIEADLRRPVLADRLALDGRVGLADVLTGGVSMSEATVAVELEQPQSPSQEPRTLDVLLAGDATPSSPGALLESHAMADVLEQARAVYDFVVVDSAPLESASDAFPLLGRVDGVVIVGRVRHSRRDLAQRLQVVLERSGAPLRGLVVNGVRPSDARYIDADLGAAPRRGAGVTSDAPAEEPVAAGNA